MPRVGQGQGSRRRMRWMVIGLVLWSAAPLAEAEGPAAAAVTDSTPKEAVQASNDITSIAPPSDQAIGRQQLRSAEGVVRFIQVQQESFSSFNLFNDSSLQIIAADGQAQRFALRPKTTIVWQQGQQIGLDRLGAGDQIRVYFTERRGERVARSIEVLQATLRPFVPMNVSRALVDEYPDMFAPTAAAKHFQKKKKP